MTRTGGKEACSKIPTPTTGKKEVSLYTERDSEVGVWQTQRPDFAVAAKGSIFEDKYDPFAATAKGGMLGQPKPTLESRSVYFHIPFCAKKCPYCHFFVLPSEERYIAPFIDALKKEWALRVPFLEGSEILSLYFGGGTPTSLSYEHYAQLFELIFESGVCFGKECEITLEANPDDVSVPLMRSLSSLGVNRISLGVQSLVESELQFLGRGHGVAGALGAIDAIHQAGIENLSVDLIYELPHQTVESFRKTLDQLEGLPLTHLSLYNLMLEPRSLFFKKRRELTPFLPPGEESLAMLNEALSRLATWGMQRYEISAFARPGFHSRHNIGYWTGRPFLGLGPAAFSYWEGSRFCNTERFASYIRELGKGVLPVGFQEKLPPLEHVKELLAVELRMVEGVLLSQFEAREGALPEEVRGILETLKGKGWVEEVGGRVRLTKQGLLFYDNVGSMFA